MDLGFGSSNQILGNQAANSILRATQAQEEAIQSEISKYDALLDANDTELEKLRERRLQQMKLQHRYLKLLSREHNCMFRLLHH